MIRSPVDGVVLTRTIEPGQTVAASLQAPELFTIAEDLAKMKIELAVDEADIGQVKVGQGVSFTVDAFPDRQFRGTVEQVRLSATTTSNVVTYPVVVTVDNSDGTLLPGLTVNAEIEVSKRDDVLRISNAALRYKPADSAASQQQAAAPRCDACRQRHHRRPGAHGRAVEGQSATAGGIRCRGRQHPRTPGRAPGGGESRRRQLHVRRWRSAHGLQAVPAATCRRRSGNACWNATSRISPRSAPAWTTRSASNGMPAVSALTSAKRAPLYKLVDGKPQQVQVRIGASDGTNTEVSGDIKQGDPIVTGERAAE